MITVDGGFAKIVNTENEVSTSVVEMKVFIKIYYSDTNAKYKLDDKVRKAGFLKTNNEDSYCKKITVRPLILSEVL